MHYAVNSILDCPAKDIRRGDGTRPARAPQPESDDPLSQKQRTLQTGHIPTCSCAYTLPAKVGPDMRFILVLALFKLTYIHRSQLTNTILPTTRSSPMFPIHIPKTLIRSLIHPIPCLFYNVLAPLLQHLDINTHPSMCVHPHACCIQCRTRRNIIRDAFDDCEWRPSRDSITVF